MIKCKKTQSDWGGGTIYFYKNILRFFLGGFGLGMMYVPAVVAVGYWFEKRRSLVTGEQMRENSFFLNQS